MPVLLFGRPMSGRAVLSPAVSWSPRQDSTPVEPGRIECWAPEAVRLDPWTVLRLARYRRRVEVAPAIWQTAHAMAARACALVEPVARLAPVRVRAAGPGGAVLEDGAAFTGRAVGRLLAGCPLAVVFVLTLGPRLEAEVAALAERRQLLESYLLDTAGWAAIERAVRALRLDLRARLAPAGWRPTHRLAPGYGDWPLVEQPALLSVFGDHDLPVRLSEHGVLVPFKSITGLFGVTRG
jgi:hypothetical protein